MHSCAAAKETVTFQVCEQRKERTICVDSKSSCDSMRSRQAKNLVDAKKLGSSVELRRTRSGSLLFATESLTLRKQIDSLQAAPTHLQERSSSRCGASLKYICSWHGRECPALQRLAACQVPSADHGLNAFPSRRLNFNTLAQSGMQALVLLLCRALVPQPHRHTPDFSKGMVQSSAKSTAQVPLCVYAVLDLNPHLLASPSWGAGSAATPSAAAEALTGALSCVALTGRSHAADGWSGGSGSSPAQAPGALQLGSQQHTGGKVCKAQRRPTRTA